MKHVNYWRYVIEDTDNEDHMAIGCCLTFLYNLADNGNRIINVVSTPNEADYVSFVDKERYNTESFNQKITDLLCEYPDVREIEKSIIDTVDVQRIFRLGDDKKRNFEFCEKLDEIVS